MQEIGERWSELSVEDRALYDQRAVDARSQAQRPHVEEESFPAEATPLGLGRETQPLRHDVVQPPCEGDAIARGKDAWQALTGKKVMEPPESFHAEAPPGLTCGELYGPSQCAVRLDADVKERRDALRRALRHVSHCLSKMESLQLLCLCPAGVPHPADVPSHLFFLGSFTILRDPAVTTRY